MAVLNAPHSLLLCRCCSEMASPASPCSSSRLGAGCCGPTCSPSLPSVLALCPPCCQHLLPADPVPQNSCSSAPGCFPSLCFALPMCPGCWVQGCGAEGGVCPGTPAQGSGAWVGNVSVGRRAGSRSVRRLFIFCPLGGRLSPLPRITSHVTSWEA